MSYNETMRGEVRRALNLGKEAMIEKFVSVYIEACSKEENFNPDFFQGENLETLKRSTSDLWDTCGYIPDNRENL